MSEPTNPSEVSPAQITAYALGELQGDDLTRFEALLRESHDTNALSQIAEIKALASAVSAALRSENGTEPSVSLRQAIESRLARIDQPSQETAMISSTSTTNVRAWYLRPRFWAIAATAASFVGIGLIFWQSQPGDVKVVALKERSVAQTAAEREEQLDEALSPATTASELGYSIVPYGNTTTRKKWGDVQLEGEVAAAPATTLSRQTTPAASTAEEFSEQGQRQLDRGRPAARPATPTNLDAQPVDDLSALGSVSVRRESGINDFRDRVAKRNSPLSASDPQHDGYGIRVLDAAPEAKGLAIVKGRQRTDAELETLAQLAKSGERRWADLADRRARVKEALSTEALRTEAYDPIIENLFLSPSEQPLSTFSIDVDTASYANVRRFLNSGRLPPPSAVRIEELVNYFSYNYPQPNAREPFSVNMEAAECPWQPGHLLLRVGLKGKEVHKAERPASNLVFLLDVSGSMSDQNKLPLLKTALQMLVGELKESDRVTIVTYAGNAGLVLSPTSGDQKEKIQTAIEQLSAGGSTNGSAGITLAYEQAAAGFLKEGTNRIILATDGDLNVGVTSDEALVELIKQKAAGGVFLTVLGFGEGNLKDSKMEKLADNGNGVYAYIDGVREARKVLVEQMSGSLVTIAKDVKIQIEFNPAQIESYRLLGYENRILPAEDFNNDKKDAGEIGAGHTVTALYQLVPVGAGNKDKAEQPQATGVEPLKYQQAKTQQQPKEPQGELTAAAAGGELLTLKLRYKEPDGVESRLVEYPLKDRGGRFSAPSQDMQFAAAVASFGMILRGSEHRGSGNTSAVAEIAAGALGSDANGYRAEFMDLVRRAEQLGVK